MNRHLVTVNRYRKDRYGDRVLVVSFQIGQCVFSPRTSTENDDRSTTVIADAELFVPSYAGVQPSDEIVFEDGTAWEVQGRVEEWASPWNSWQPGNVVPLKRTTG